MNERVEVTVGVETCGAKPIRNKAQALWDLYKSIEPQYMMNAPKVHYMLTHNVEQINEMSDERYAELVLKIQGELDR